MKKNYVLNSLLVTLLLSVSNLLQSAEYPALEFEGINVSVLAGSYDKGNGNEFNITFRGLSGQDNMAASCFGTYRENISVAKFDNKTTTNYSYIQIENTGTANITKVEFKGMAIGGASQMIYAYSMSGTTDDNFYDNAGILLFPQTSSSSPCNVQLLDGEGAMYPSVPAGTKFIRLVRSDNYLDWDTSNENGNSPLLYGFTIYTDKNPGTNTAISTPVGSEFQIYIASGGLNFTEPVSVVNIYDISGMPVKTISGIQCISLNELTSGIYIIKAMSQTGKSLVTKIAR